MKNAYALAVVGLGAVLAASSAQAALGVYYAKGSVDSMWGEDTNSSFTAYAGPMRSDSFGSVPGTSYLTGTWNFNKLSDASAPGVTGVNIGPNGYALGHGSLVSSVSDTGFSAAAHGIGTVEYDDAGDIDTLYANGRSSFALNFSVPGDAVDYKFVLNGTASSDAYSVLTVRIADFDAGNVYQGNLVNFVTDGSQDAFSSQTWDNVQFLLAAGHSYAVDLYVSANFPYADPVYPARYASEASYDISGGLVPEPAAYAMALSAMGLLSFRRRTK